MCQEEIRQCETWWSDIENGGYVLGVMVEGIIFGGGICSRWTKFSRNWAVRNSDLMSRKYVSQS